MKTVRISLYELVRDKTPEELRKKKIAFKSSPLIKKELAPNFILKKLSREIVALSKAEKEDRKGRFASIYELLETLAREYKIKTQCIRKEQKRRRRKKGGYSKKILLYWVEKK